MAKGYWGEQLQNALGAFLGTPGAPSGAYLRDFQHASKTFVSDSYALSPKYKFTFHTYFEINQSAYTPVFPNMGLLVKDVRLPAYRFATATLNQYNRKRIVQTKINYDPVEITFHDDNSNIINKLWYAYYTYYYKDAAKLQINPVNNTTQSTMADYNVRNIYSDDTMGNDDWGYIGEPSSIEAGCYSPGSSKAGSKSPFFKSITVYGFNQHKFTAYQLINPIIANFAHDTYAYDQGNGVMQNRMTLEYETVLYKEGTYNANDLPVPEVGYFADAANYDRISSPISIPGANGKILGPNGILDGVGGFIQDLGNGNILGAIKTAGAIKNNLRNYDLKTAGKIEAENLLLGALGQLKVGKTINNTTRNQKVQIPIPRSTPTTNGAGSPTVTQKPGNINDLQEVTINSKKVTPTAGVQLPISNGTAPDVYSFGRF